MHDTKRLPIDELRIIVRNLDANAEDMNNGRWGFTVAELVKLGQMHLASGWDIYPDAWTKRQVVEALAGYPPHWAPSETDEPGLEVPVYFDGEGYPHKRIAV